MILDFISVDIEPTNRCNASCYFCPRDQTPQQGLMKPETFAQALARTVELAPYAQSVLNRTVIVSLCGLGEPLLNKHVPSWVGEVRAAGFTCAMASNGALLTEDVAEALLDAGLSSIQLNVGERGEEYERIYKLPWERTLANVQRFVELAEGRCHTQVVLVNHRVNDGHVDAMKQFWTDQGVREFVEFDLINRGGALEVDSMQYATFPEQREADELLSAGRDEPVVCQVPFSLPFVGYDGQYYLCCSDWRKEAPMGSVFDRSFVEVTADKLEHVSTREPVCKSCNHDPLNRVTEELRLRGSALGTVAELDAVVADCFENDAVVRGFLDAMGPDVGVPITASRRRGPSIPVRAVS